MKITDINGFTMLVIRIECPISIKELKRKLLAIQELTGQIPTVRIFGHYEDNKNDVVCIDINERKIVHITDKYLTVDLFREGLVKINPEKVLSPEHIKPYLSLTCEIK